MKKPASVEIELGQDYRPYTVGRNGNFAIGRLKVWEGTGRCFIDPISFKRGIVLNSGLMIEASDMDRLATAWLQSRGKYPKGKS